MRTRIALFILLFASETVWAQESAPRLLRAQDLPIEVEPEALQRQYNALLGMSLASIEYTPRGPIHLIQGNTGLVLPLDVAERKEGDSAADILPLIKDILLARGGETLTVSRNSVVDPSKRALKISLSIRGIPVIHGMVSIGYDATTKRVSGVTAHFIPDRDLPRTPKVSAQRAEQIVPEVLAIAEKLSADVEIMEGTYLGYFADPASPTPPQLVWAVRAKMPSGAYEMFYVDAITGIVIARDELSQPLTRVVYNLNNQNPAVPNGLPNPMSPDQVNADSIALEGYNRVGTADSRLLQRFPWAASDFPSTARILVRWGISANALHDLIGGIDYLWFSAPTPNHYSFTKPFDIPAHEYAHGIGRRSFGIAHADLEDRQADALQEAFADFAATVVHVAQFNGPAITTWVMGEGAFKENSAWAYRSFANPNSDPLLHWVPGNDWFPRRDMGIGFRHENSTILSHGYYLLNHGGFHSRVDAPEIPEIEVPAIHLNEVTAEARAREIFFRAYRDDTMGVGPTF